MNVVSAELHPVKWPRTRWLTLIALVFAAHVALIFAFGERKQKIFPPVVTDVPRLQLANNSDALLALNDPTLFAAPNPNDFASAVWLQMSVVKQPSFRFAEPPRYLPAPDAENLGATFSRFMQTNRFAGFQFDLKPPELSAPVLPLQPVFAEKSTLQIEGDLAQRELLSPITLTNWPLADVLAPSVVQALVDASGNVVSTILLPPDDSVQADARYDVADRRALELARAACFAPSSRPTVGQLIFNWRTVAPPATNLPAGP